MRIPTFTISYLLSSHVTVKDPLWKKWMKEFKCGNLGIFAELVLCAGGVSEIPKAGKQFTGSQGHNEKQAATGSPAL